CQQFEQRQHNAQAEMSRGVSDRAEYSQRGEIHHEICELEHRLGKALREQHHWPALGFLDEGQADAEQNAENDNLQDLSFGDRLGDIFREDVEDELTGRLRGRRNGLLRGLGGKRHAHASFAEIYGNQADDESDGRDNLEKHQRLDRHASDFFQFRVAGDADDKRSKQQRSDDDLDEAQKNRAEDLKFHCGRWSVVTHLRARKQATRIHSVNERRAVAYAASNTIASHRSVMSTTGAIYRAPP